MVESFGQRSACGQRRMGSGEDWSFRDTIEYHRSRDTIAYHRSRDTITYLRSRDTIGYHRSRASIVSFRRDQLREWDRLDH